MYVTKNWESLTCHLFLRSRRNTCYKAIFKSLHMNTNRSCPLISWAFYPKASGCA